MSFLFRFLPTLAFGVFIMNDSFNLGFIPIAVAIAMLFVSAYSVWIYFQDRKQIRVLIKPAKRISWLEITFAIIVTVFLLILLIIQYNERELFHPTRNHALFTLYLYIFSILPWSLAMFLISFLINPARSNRDGYLISYIFLESGLKLKGLKRKIYPWDHFTSFEVVPLEHTIDLVFRNGEKLTLKINKKDFDLQLLDVKLFLWEKISAKNFPASS